MMNEEIVAVDKQSFDFDKELAMTYEAFLQEHQVGVELDVSLKKLLAYGKEEMDTATYVQVLYMEGIKYEQQKNINAARYCALRIFEIQQCYVNPKKKRPRLLDTSPYIFPEDMMQFVVRYSDYLEETFRMINKRLLLITAIVFLIAAIVLMVVLKISIVIAGVEALLLGLLNYILQKRKMPIIFMKHQLQRIEHHVEEDVLAFDRPIRFS